MMLQSRAADKGERVSSTLVSNGHFWHRFESGWQSTWNRFDGKLAVTLLFGSFLLALARGMASTNEVHLIDRFDFWLVGLIPTTVMLYIAGDSPARVGSTLRPQGHFYLRSWLFGLLSFIILQEFHFTDGLALPIIQATGFKTLIWSDLVLCLVYAGLGIICATIILPFQKSSCRPEFRSLFRISTLLVANWLMLFTFVFFNPF